MYDCLGYSFFHFLLCDFIWDVYLLVTQGSGLLTKNLVQTGLSLLGCTSSGSGIAYLRLCLSVSIFMYYNCIYPI